MAEAAAAAAGAGGDAGGGVSLGKGAWDCDNNCEIPPEKEVWPTRSIAAALRCWRMHRRRRHLSPAGRADAMHAWHP